MNKVIFIGNLTRDPELSTTNSGVNVCKFTLAIQRRFSGADGEKETDFFNIVVWRGLGENCNKYLKKGSKCCVIGELQNRSYEAQDGTKRYVTEVIANEVEFLSSIGTTKESPKREGPITIEGGNETIQLGLEPIDPDDSLPF